MRDWSLCHKDRCVLLSRLKSRVSERSINEIDGGIMEMNPEDDEILVKDLFQFSEFKENDEYSEISGTEDEVEKIYDLINEYMDQL